MKTSELRTAVKARIHDARVASTSGTSGDSWTVRFKSPSDLKTIRAMIKTLGLKELYHDVEGSRWDWSYVFHVVVKE